MRAEKNAHIVESVVYAEDLTATWEDVSKGFVDWRECRVDGSHLKEPEDAAQAGKMMQAIDLDKSGSVSLEEFKAIAWTCATN